jgi:hypothetical protein
MKNVIILYIIGLFVHTTIHAQENVRIIPFQGIKMTQNGIGCKSVDITLEGVKWVSNQLPRNKQFKIKVDKPTGFTIEDENVFPGISILFTTTKHDTLGYAENLFGDDSEGMYSEFLSNLSVNLSFNEDVLPGDTVLGEITFFDQKSEKYLRLDCRFIITGDDAELDQSRSTSGYSSFEGFEGQATGLELYNMKFYADSLSRPTQTGLVFEFQTKGQYALDLHGSHVDIVVFNKDGSVISNFGYGEYLTKFETKESEDNKDVKTNLQLFLSKEAYKETQAVWVRLKSRKGAWMLTGAATL